MDEGNQLGMPDTSDTSQDLNPQLQLGELDWNTCFIKYLLLMIYPPTQQYFTYMMVGGYLACPEGKL